MSLHTIGRNGELRLTFAQHEAQTALIENFSRPPLQVMRPIRDAAGCLCVYLLSPTGGVVQNDHYTIQIDVGQGAHGLFTTQSATKIYRMPEGCAEQYIHIDVGQDAVFEFIPDAAILFADADFQQHIEVNLQPGAMILLYEIVMPGRLAHGEHLKFRRYSNRLVVRDSAGLVLYDNAVLEPACTDFNAIGRLEGYACWGSAYLLGDLEARGINPAEFCQTHQSVTQVEGALGSLSPLYRNGVVARMVSPRLETIYKVFGELRNLTRTQYMKLPPAILRK